MLARCATFFCPALSIMVFSTTSYQNLAAKQQNIVFIFVWSLGTAENKLTHTDLTSKMMLQLMCWGNNYLSTQPLSCTSIDLQLSGHGHLMDVSLILTLLLQLWFPSFMTIMLACYVLVCSLAVCVPCFQLKHGHISGNSYWKQAPFSLLHSIHLEMAGKTQVRLILLMRASVSQCARQNQLSSMSLKTAVLFLSSVL